jgi:rare lipoprotein A (peptidoglycan hydrolase)
MLLPRLNLLLFATIFFTSCSEVIPVEKHQAKTSALKVVKKASKPQEPSIQTFTGMASWYSIQTNFGRKTASGYLLSNGAYTAAHKTLPFGTRVRVTCLFNGKSEVVRITDRGPYTKGRVIDVTMGSAQRLGFYSRGITKVKVEVLSLGNWKYKHP